jgi:taurine dioxygenase
MTMATVETQLEIVPLSPEIGAEIRGIDLREPLDAAAFGDIEQVWLDRGVLLFRDQRLSEDDQLRFAARFGELGRLVSQEAHPGQHPSVMLVSNIREDGKLIGALPDGEMFFHSDQCYVERPCKATFLYAIEVPSTGGNTIFANTYRAYETLPETVKARIAGRVALNVYDYGGSATKRSTDVAPDALRFAHPIVRTHPQTSRRALYINRLMTHSIVGMSPVESEALLTALFDYQEQPRFLYEHRWRPGDLVVWDNRCTLHARTDFSAAERRLLRRVIVLGERPE